MSAAPVSTTGSTHSRARQSARLRIVTPDDVSRHARTVVRSRWPRMNADYVTWRTSARYRVEVSAGRRPEDLSTWIRSAVYELIVEDQRADRGQTAYAHELDVLLCALSGTGKPLIRSDLLDRAVQHLHPRDVIMIRLVLAGHPRATVARRLRVPDGHVDSSYGRVRARLRATIGSDHELREALVEAANVMSRPTRQASRPGRNRAGANRPAANRAGANRLAANRPAAIALLGHTRLEIT